MTQKLRGGGRKLGRRERERRKTGWSEKLGQRARMTA